MMRGEREYMMEQETIGLNLQQNDQDYDDTFPEITRNYKKQ